MTLVGDAYGFANHALACVSLPELGESRASEFGMARERDGKGAN
jgi:hypothetical protein